MKPRGEFGRNPPSKLYSFLFLNWWKLVKIKFNKKVSAVYDDFPKVSELGSTIPTVELETTDGRRINTADFVGKKLQIFEFGAIT